MKDLKLLLSSVLIILAFFLGQQFSEEKHNLETKNIQDKNEYVDIDVLKTKVKIKSSNENIIITVNGNKTSSGVIDL